MKIATIQALLGVTPDGIWGPVTQSALNAASKDVITKIQTVLGVTPDGVFGAVSVAALQAAMVEVKPSPPLQPDPPVRPCVDPKSFHLSLKGEALILDQEGIDQPGAWQGGDSGVTIGVGYDLGTVTLTQFTTDWKNSIPADQFSRLAATVGAYGDHAHELCLQLRDITIPASAAITVFNNSTVPQFWDETLHAFPGVEWLPPDVQGALESLVYNRGASMAGDRRAEMRTIQAAVAPLHGITSPPSNSTIKPILGVIATAITSMTRLWPKGSGVYNHRLAEAALVQRTYNDLA